MPSISLISGVSYQLGVLCARGRKHLQRSHRTAIHVIVESDTIGSRQYGGHKPGAVTIFTRKRCLGVYVITCVASKIKNNRISLITLKVVMSFFVFCFFFFSELNLCFAGISLN